MHGLTVIHQALQTPAQTVAPDTEIIFLMIWMVGSAMFALWTKK